MKSWGRSRIVGKGGGGGSERIKGGSVVMVRFSTIYLLVLCQSVHVFELLLGLDFEYLNVSNSDFTN